MSLHRSGHCVQVAGPGVTSERLPFWKCVLRRADRRIDICRGCLRDRSDLFAGRRIEGVEKYAVHWLTPFSTNKVAEPAAMTVKPRLCFFRVLRRRPVFHGDEFLSNAHVFDFGRSNFRPSDAGNQPNIFRWHGAPTGAQYR